MRKLKSFKFKSTVVAIENNEVDLSCGLHFSSTALDFDVEIGKTYEFELHGDEVNEYYITLSAWRTSEEWEEI